ncbi:MAG: DUF2127 domain-containing protein [Candidatus Pacearchaeota archaeon]|jgi:uncharacterized membrane protein HdeD (DUF308 family)
MKKSVKNKSKNTQTEKRVKKNAPIVVKILSIIGYIFSILFLIIGILSLIVSIGLAKSSEPIVLPADFPAEFVDLFTNHLVPFLVGMGIAFIICGIIGIILSRGLWKGKNWARIVLIVFSIIGMISNLMSLFAKDFSSIVPLIIDVLIIWYLTANKEALKYFR